MRTAGRGRVRPADSLVDDSLRTTARVPYWLDDTARPDPQQALRGSTTADLAVVGGGYSGLWTALLAKERDPHRDVVVCEAFECGQAASGRNGGFAEPSLTHGFANGLARWPDEMPRLLELGRANLDELVETVRRYAIDCRLDRTGELNVATAPHQVAELGEQAKQMRGMGLDCELLDEQEVRRRVDSPTYLAALYDPLTVLVEPARLAWGLRQACLDLGVQIHEHTAVTGVSRAGDGVDLLTTQGSVRADQVVLATNAFPSLLRRLRWLTVPVYDYALVTEPLRSDQLDRIGWAGREGIGDSGNRFHYYRRTRDDRILFGGYDAIYHYGSRIDPSYDDRDATYRLLAGHFFETFPQLDDVVFSHAWGGVIDTCTRFSAFYGTALGGRLAYAAGYTGLGVSATRFAGQVVLDLLAGEQTERTALAMVRTRPVPFPPEPLRYAGIQATRWSLARADDRAGKQNVWLRLMDRLGLGFDS
ncbi:MAG: NAD(P)/FAD-dependent oxidoreductase [Nocardioidaceae bacterium]